MTATLLDIDDVQLHVETDLDDDALQRLMDAEEAEIVTRFGSHGAADGTGPTVTRRVPGGDLFAFLGQRSVSITQVDETIGSSSGETTTTLSADDYQSWDDGRSLRRLNDGTNARDLWGKFMDITFVGFDDRDRRKRVLIDLVKLSVQYEAAKSSKIGDVSVSFTDYQKERESILSTMAQDYYVFV